MSIAKLTSGVLLSISVLLPITGCSPGTIGARAR